jgi:hypothetical protein
VGLRGFDDWERQPLLLLDVDGVINDKACLRGAERPWRHRVLEVAGTRVCLPAYMPALIRYLALATDVWWRTSWRHLANQHLALLLGIDRRPVLRPEHLSERLRPRRFGATHPSDHRDIKRAWPAARDGSAG